MSKFILGPSVDGVLETQAGIDALAADNTVRQSISFDFPAIVAGGTIRLRMVSPGALASVAVKPTNVYGFYVPSDALPLDLSARTADWFFGSGAKSGVTSVVGVADDAPFVVAVAGVTPSLTPYFVQTVIEYPS